MLEKGNMIYQNKAYKLSQYLSFQGKLESNEVGTDILAFIENSAIGSSLNDLIAFLIRKYEVEEATLRTDVSNFIEKCIGKDILVNDEIEEDCRQVLRDIRRIQGDLPQLTVSNFGYVARLGQRLTPGCQSCYRGKWAVFFVGVECNLRCFFCPYTAVLQRFPQEQGSGNLDESISFLGLTFHTFRELMLQFSLIKDQFDAIAWVGGETMMPSVQKRILPLIRYFHESYPDYHQWMYTNGTFATVSTMHALYDAGIRELRFNLAATNFSSRVNENMSRARQIFEYLCIEIPMTGESYQGLVRNASRILDTGLDQMNLAEFIVGANHLAQKEKLRSEGKLYNFMGFITSPISSRHYTYKIIRKAIDEKWPVVINDCSNEYKYYKLSVQKSKGINIFQGARDYWNNNFSIRDVGAFNDWLLTRSTASSDETQR